MSAQTSYDINHGLAFEGMVYALNPHDIVSRAVETVAGADFGIAVSRGTDKDNQIVIGGTDFLGITVRTLDRESANDSTIQYNEKDTAAVLRSGYIYATCPAGCTPGQAVKYNDTTGVLDQGAAGVGETQLDGAVWDTTAAAGALGVIRLETLATTAGV